jgi:hypothetical protein
MALLVYSWNEGKFHETRARRARTAKLEIGQRQLSSHSELRFWLCYELVSESADRKQIAGLRGFGPEEGGTNHLSAASGVAYGTLQPFTLLLNRPRSRDPNTLEK